MTHGGPRQGAGRRKGAIAKHRKIAAAKSIEAVGEGMTPLEFLLKTMRDENNEYAQRLSAARDAAPYVHPRLAAVQHTGDKENPICHEVIHGDADTFTGRIARLSSRGDSGSRDEGVEH